MKFMRARICSSPSSIQGEVSSGNAFITVLDPYGSTAANCSWEAISWVDGSVEETGSTCVINATRPAHDFNGDWVRVTVELPASYLCNPVGAFGGCWWQVRLDYNVDPYDRTTWEARIVGNPIHLVND